jgi:Holliday junction resolvasome RuvABC endonuclease subunit
MVFADEERDILKKYGVIAGIDYSMTFPAMCMYDPFIDRYYYFYTTTEPSRIRNDGYLTSSLIPKSVSFLDEIKTGKVNQSMQRYETIAREFSLTLIQHDVKFVFLEGYAMNTSTGSGFVFSIAEHTAILKRHLMEFGNQCDCLRIVAPTHVKKMATGKGNASKVKMKESFEQLAPKIAQRPLEPVSHYMNSPYTDLVDAFWILRTGINDYLLTDTER